MKNDKSQKTEEKGDYVTVTASSVEELLKKSMIPCTTA